MAVVFDMGLHPLIRELARVDPELFRDIKRIYPFQDPLSNGILVEDNRSLFFAFGFENMEEFGFKFPITSSENKRRLSKPRHVPCLNKRKIIQIAYDRHVLILTEDGETFGWGDNSGYPLGDNIERMFGSYSRPCLVGSDVVKIAAGRKHSLFIDSDGYVFGVGNNRHGQTHPDLTIKFFRKAAQNKEIRDKATDVYCTTHLSMALTITNILYIWGQICNKIINMVLSLERYGNVKKLLPLELPFGVKMYDVRIMMLTEQKELFQIQYVANFHKFLTKKLDTPGNIVDIIGGRNGCYALIDENGNITMFRLDQNFCTKQRIFTRIKSHIDAAQLYRMPLKFSFFELSMDAKDMSIIEKLGLFNSEIGTEFKIRWQRNQSFVLGLESSVFFKHLPKLKHQITGNEFVWPGEPNTIPYRGLKPFQFNNKTRPSCITMYAYMVFVHTQKLPVGIIFDLDEFNYLVNYFKDVRSSEAFPSSFEPTLIPTPEFSPPAAYQLDLELLKHKKFLYSLEPNFVPGNTVPEPVPLLDLAPMSQEDMIQSYRTDSSECPCLFSKNPVLINDHTEEMRRAAVGNEQAQNNQAQNSTGSTVEITEPVAGPSRMATLSEVQETSASILNTLRIINLAQQSSLNQSINQSTNHQVELANEDSMETCLRTLQMEFSLEPIEISPELIETESTIPSSTIPESFQIVILRTHDVPNPAMFQVPSRSVILKTDFNSLETLILLPSLVSYCKMKPNISELKVLKRRINYCNPPSTSGVSQNPVTPSNTSITSSSSPSLNVFIPPNNPPEQSESQMTTNESINEASPSINVFIPPNNPPEQSESQITTNESINEASPSINVFIPPNNPPEQSESQITTNESINEELPNKRMRMTNDHDEDEENQ